MAAGEQQRQRVLELLTMAIADPARALTWADSVLVQERDPWVLSVARQARGIVLRDGLEPAQAIPELRKAVRLAVRSADRDREADVRATLGVALATAGRTRAALDELARSLDTVEDQAVEAKIRMRRGHVLYFLLERPAEALADLDLALPGLRSAGEDVWEARTLNLIGLCHVAEGRSASALRAVEAAEEIFQRKGQAVESVITLHNRGYIAHCDGDVPTALRLYDEARARYAALGEESMQMLRDYSEALLDAGLAREAVELLDTQSRSDALAPADRAELLLWKSLAELAADAPETAEQTAKEAERLFRRQGREWWLLRARLAVLRASHLAGQSSRSLAGSAAATAAAMEETTSDEAAVAWLLAGTVAARYDLAEATDLLDRAAVYRSHRSGPARVTGWHARALRLEVSGDRRGLLVACRRGVAALDDHRATLGSAELRALVTRRGDDLAALALRHALTSGPRVFLEWSERWRATSLSQPPVHPPDDEELARDLAALRDTRRRLAEAKATGSQTAARLDDERARLELAIRRRSHYLAGVSAEMPGFETARLVDSLGDATFVQLVEVDRLLHALVARGRRVRHVVVGPVSEAEQAVTAARFALRQTARGRPSDLDDVGERLQATLLGEVARRLDGAPVVISPPGRLIAAPWALTPALVDVPLTMTPSAALWLRARSSRTSSGRRVLISGPGLASGGAEIDTLQERHRDAVVLRHGQATVERAVAALDGASVAHVAAHGQFREDSPLFSSLELDDGPLTVHDLQRLDRAPHRMVLSACESGVVAPIGAGEMLGLVAAMLAMGSAGVVSSVAKVNDQATAEVMVELHAALDAGDDLGAALLRARRAARGDRVKAATAAAFSGMGM